MLDITKNNSFTYPCHGGAIHQGSTASRHQEFRTLTRVCRPGASCAREGTETASPWPSLR